MENSKKNIAIILLGRPGSGKDTQAELLAKKFGLVHIVSSLVIRKALSSHKKTLWLHGKIWNVEKQKQLQKSGALVDFHFVDALIRNEIKKVNARNKGLIMSASPRSKIELKEEWPMLKKLYGEKNIFVFHVRISPQEVYIRNLKRHRKDLPELDTKKIIKKRLEVFNLYTLPVIKLLKKQKKIIAINGEQKVMKIHLDIIESLKNKKLI